MVLVVGARLGEVALHREMYDKREVECIVHGHRNGDFLYLGRRYIELGVQYGGRSVPSRGQNIKIVQIKPTN